MDETHSETGDIAIRCPGCGQRFKVGPDLRDRMVECGSCDQRFRVDDQVMVRQRRYYPGERRDASLERFGRVPTKSTVSPAFEPMHYETEVAPSMVDPVSPFRVILGAAGVAIALIVALILVFGGSPGGVLDGASVSKRLILASFAAILTMVLLVVANPRAVKKGGLAGLAFAVGLVSLPFFFKEGTVRSRSELDVSAPIFKERPEIPVEVGPLAELKDEMHYDPMAEALQAYGPDLQAQGKTAIGVWLRDLREFNKSQVVDYLTKSTSASNASWIYPRPPSDFLMVLVDVENNLEKVAKLCSRFGKVTRVIEELQVVEVKVINDTFVQGPLDKLSDPENPSFYELNRRELESIDIRRAAEAVNRLGVAEPKVFRKDIVVRMQELLDHGDLELQTDIAKALSRWSEADDGSVERIREVALAAMDKSQTVPRPIIAFLVEKRDREVIPLLDQLWLEEAGTWEALYGEMGPAIEDSVLVHLEDESPNVQMSAATLLGRVGTPKSLPALRKAGEDARSEMAVVINRAIEAIEKRN